MKKSILSILMTALLMLIFSVTSVQATDSSWSEMKVESNELSEHVYIHLNSEIGVMANHIFGTCYHVETNPSGGSTVSCWANNNYCYTEGRGPRNCPQSFADFYGEVESYRIIFQSDDLYIIEYTLFDQTVLEDYIYIN